MKRAFLFLPAMVSLISIGLCWAEEMHQEKACEEKPELRGQTGDSGWKHDIIFSDSEKLDGVAVGDADNDGTTEVLACGFSGKLFLVEYDEEAGQWRGKTLWESPEKGEMIAAEIGDFDPIHEGVEAVVCGMKAGPETDIGAGSLEMVSLEDDKWTHETIFTDSHLIHGVTVGDLDPDREGAEIVCGGFSRNAVLVYRDEGEWKSEVIYSDPGRIKKLIIDDFDSGHPGNELIVVSQSRMVTQVYKQKGEWESKLIYKAPMPIARVCSGYPGETTGEKRIVIGDDGGNVILIEKMEGDVWNSTRLLHDTAKNRGVWIGDIDKQYPGNEIIAAGYSKKLYVIGKKNGKWETSRIYEDSDRIHEIRTGDFYPEHPGEEIVLVGYSKNVVMVY